MKVLTASAAIPFTNSASCTGLEFPFDTKNFNIAVATVNGRYPDHGHLMNEVCDEIAYVLSGTGTIGTGDTLHRLNPGDACLIKAGERFFWEGQNLKLLLPCSPAFYPEQHKEVA